MLNKVVLINLHLCHILPLHSCFKIPMEKILIVQNREKLRQFHYLKKNNY